MTWRIVVMGSFATGLMCLVAASFMQFGTVPGLAVLGASMITLAIVMGLMGPPDDRRRF